MINDKQMRYACDGQSQNESNWIKECRATANGNGKDRWLLRLTRDVLVYYAGQFCTTACRRLLCVHPQHVGVVVHFEAFIGS